jgi:hypothetical protein
MLATRDPVTASLRKGDPSVIQTLRMIEVRLRQALAYRCRVPTIEVSRHLVT